VLEIGYKTYQLSALLRCSRLPFVQTSAIAAEVHEREIAGFPGECCIGLSHGLTLGQRKVISHAAL
jgi:hypothetical protein